MSLAEFREVLGLPISHLAAVIQPAGALWVAVQLQ